MSKGIPSRNEISKAIIVNIITATLGVVLGLAITTWWKQREQKAKQTIIPGMMAGGVA